MRLPLVLIGVLITSPSLYAVSDHPNTPEQNLYPDFRDSQQSADLNRVSQIDIEAIYGPVKSPSTKDTPNKRDQNTPANSQKRNQEPTVSLWSILGQVAIVASIIACAIEYLVFMSTRKATKAALESTEINKKTVLSERANMVVSNIRDDHVTNREGFRVVVTWKNVGKRTAMLIGVCVECQVVDRNKPIPKITEGLTPLGGQVLEKDDVCDFRSRLYPIIESHRMFRKPRAVLYGMTCIKYRDTLEQQDTIAKQHFTATARNLLEGGPARFDFSFDDWQPPKPDAR